MVVLYGGHLVNSSTRCTKEEKGAGMALPCSRLFVLGVTNVCTTLNAPPPESPSSADGDEGT